MREGKSASVRGKSGTFSFPPYFPHRHHRLSQPCVPCASAKRDSKVSGGKERGDGRAEGGKRTEECQYESRTSERRILSKWLLVDRFFHHKVSKNAAKIIFGL